MTKTPFKHTLRRNMIKYSMQVCSFYKLHSVHATNTYYNKGCSLCLGWVVVGSIIGFVDKSAHIEFHYIQNSCMSLNSLKI